MDNCCRCESFGIWSMIGERSWSPNHRKTISETKTGIERQHICRTCTYVRHPSLGSALVRASHRLSEGYRFNPRLDLRYRITEIKSWRTFIDYLTHLCWLYMQRYTIAAGKSKFQNLCCLYIIVSMCTMASLITSFPAVKTVSWFWPIFDSTCVKFCHGRFTLNRYRWDELLESELPVLFSTSKLQSLYALSFLLSAIVCAFHWGTRMAGACACWAAHVCKQLDFTQPFLRFFQCLTSD